VQLNEGLRALSSEALGSPSSGSSGRQGQTHGLKNKMVGHVFRFRDGKVTRFEIQDATG
jgi:hypothetical protein